MYYGLSLYVCSALLFCSVSSADNQHSLPLHPIDKIAPGTGQSMPDSEAGGASDDSNSGCTYKLWGRDTCPDTASLIYSGVMGKSFYSKGGGVNYICLPNDPDFPDNKQLGFQTQAFMYGVEFKSPATSDFFKDVHNEDAPCAVCDVEGRTRSLMIPAKRTCPTGWTQEYEGLLASQRGVQKGSEFICVANDPHPSNNSNSRTQNGGMMYVVEAKCGSLKCPPYENGAELTCVVCTK